MDEIREKFINGYYKTNEITERDLFYIKNNEELRKLFIDYFYTSDDFNFNPSVFTNSGEEILEEEYQNNDHNFEYRKKFLYQYIKLDLQTYTWNYDDLDGLISFFQLENEKEEIEEFVYDYIINSGKNINIKFNNSNIEYIIKTKKYDLINYFEDNSFNNIIPENKEIITKIIIENNIEVSSVLKESLDLPLEKYTFEELLNKCTQKVILSNESSEKYIPYEMRLVRDLKDIIKNSDYETIRNNLQNLTNLGELLLNNDLSADELYILFKNGVITLDIAERLVREDKIKIEDINDIFIDVINNSDDKWDIAERIIDKFFGYNSLLSNIKDQFIDKLIENGYSLLLVNDYISKEQIEKIKHELLNGNNKIDNIPKIYNYETMDVDFFRFVLENFKVNKINVSTSLRIDSLHTNEKKEILKKYIFANPEYEVDDIDFFDKDIFDILLKKEKYDVIVKAINMHLVTGQNNDYIDWLRDNSDNIYLYHKIITSYTFFLNNRIDMFYPVLDNEIIMDELLNTIVHNDNMIDKFDDDLYEHTKYTLARKYNLDVTKMDLLEKHFGPTLIIYIGEKNIQRILNLDIDKLEKIISIFPKVNYDLTDIEAAYESINQYSFGRKPQNLEVINIFPNILRAVNDNNVNLINKYKYKILTIIDLETINNIMKKNNFEGEPIEFLDFLLKNLEGKNVDILHEITNNVILQERKFYRNNHYYMEKNNYDILIYMQKCYDDEYLKEVIKNITSNDLYKLVNKFGIKEAKEFYDLSKSSDPDDILKYRALLESLVRKRINNLRENNPVGYTVFDELGLSYELDEKKKKSEIERCLLNRMDPKLLHDLNMTLINDKGYDVIYVYKLITCIKNKDYSNLNDKEKEDIKFVTRLAIDIIREKRLKQEPGYDDYFVNSYVIPELDKKNKIKRLFKVNESKDLYPVLMNLNIDLLEKNVFSNNEVYELLIDVMKNKKIHMLDSAFYKKFADDKINILDNEISLVGFINFFKVIVDKTNIPFKEKEKILSHFSIVEILRQANTYSSMSSIYSSILGDEDARLIKRNPDPNSSKTKDANTRFTEAVEDTLICYKKQNVTIPTFDKILQLDNNKTIEVIVGNFTSPCNITHGERTGACMRIGGVGEALYKFCLNEEAGFHIRFENPKTHKYVSRVSGFRNGNTVYLNQLRNSLDNNYENKDLIESTKQIAKLLIEMSKDSDNPIENVFITNGYAMGQSDVEKFKLNPLEITKGLNKVYTDYNYSEACLLATTAKDGYVPLDNKKVSPTYQVQRSKPKIFMEDMEFAPNQINRVHTINQLLQGKTLEHDEIDILDFKEDLLYCISNDDWYLYVDKNLNIKSEYIGIDPRAKEELDKYKTIVEGMLEAGLVKEKKHEQL